jgi:cytochrome P450
MNMNYKIIILIIILLLIISILISLFKYNLQFKLWLLNVIIVSRGVLAPNCGWFQISDLLIGDDSSGIKLYNEYKRKYGDFAETSMFDDKIYLVTNPKYIKYILDNSPDLFGVGNLKKTFFKSFMSKNVGVSSGCPWKKRRHMNEIVLDTERLHRYASKYNNDIYTELLKWKFHSNLDFNDFQRFGNTMVANIIFNTSSINDNVFKIFSEANTTEAFHNPNFKINPDIFNAYLETLNYYIDHPNEKSLVELCLSVSNNREEIIHQIPHFIFPINGLFITTIPRLLMLLCNHPNSFKKVVDEIYSLKENKYENEEAVAKIYNLTFLRKCVLETLRLNNPVITTFRTLEKDYTFDGKYSFKKGTQFLILNNPILRDPDYFKEPNKFIPERWTDEMEKSHYSISFNQGPQQCPAKELAIFLAQSFIYNFVLIKNIGETQIITKQINTENSPQVMNPCKISFKFS